MAINNKRIQTSNGPNDLLRLNELGKIPTAIGGGSGGAGGSSSTFTVTVVNNNFTILNSVYNDGTGWKKAIANDINTVGTHIVKEVFDNEVVLCSNGRISIENHGLVVGEYYFTSDDTPGLLTIEDHPISNPMVFVESDTYIQVLNYRPIDVGLPNPSGIYTEDYKIKHYNYKLLATQKTVNLLNIVDNNDFNMLVYRNGLYQTYNIDYIFDNTTKILTFTDSFVSDSDIDVVWNFVIGKTFSFLDNSDTPDNYTNNTGKYVKVNSDGTGLEFVTLELPDVNTIVDTKLNNYNLNGVNCKLINNCDVNSTVNLDYESLYSGYLIFDKSMYDNKKIVFYINNTNSGYIKITISDGTNNIEAESSLITENKSNKFTLDISTLDTDNKLLNINISAKANSVDNVFYIKKINAITYPKNEITPTMILSEKGSKTNSASYVELTNDELSINNKALIIYKLFFEVDSDCSFDVNVNLNGSYNNKTFDLNKNITVNSTGIYNLEFLNNSDERIPIFVSKINVKKLSGSGFINLKFYQIYMED